MVLSCAACAGWSSGYFPSFRGKDRVRPGRRAPGRRDPGCAENHGIPGKIVGIGLAARYKPVQAWFVVILGTCSCTFFWTSQRFWPRDQTPTTKVQAASVDSNYYHLFQCKAYKIISISIHTELSSYGMCFEIACPSGMRWFVCAIKPYGSWAARSKKKYISTIQIPDSRLPLKPRARTQAPLAVARPQQSTPTVRAALRRSSSTQPYTPSLSDAGRRRALLLLGLGGLEQWHQLLLGGELPAQVVRQLVNARE